MVCFIFDVVSFFFEVVPKHLLEEGSDALSRMIVDCEVSNFYLKLCWPHTRKHTHKHTQTHTRTHRNTHTQNHTHTNTHNTHTNTHTHTNLMLYCRTASLQKNWRLRSGGRQAAVEERWSSLQPQPLLE